jgi:hypothetical protein
MYLGIWVGEPIFPDQVEQGVVVLQRLEDVIHRFILRAVLPSFMPRQTR